MLHIAPQMNLTQLFRFTLLTSYESNGAGDVVLIYSVTLDNKELNICYSGCNWDEEMCCL